MEKLLTEIKITKVDEALKVAYGWASVIEENGEPVEDDQGDIIKTETLQKGAHGFIADVRAGKVMHKGRRVADLVESMVFTKDIQKALGIDLKKVGWFIGFKIRDDSVWKRVQSGELSAFSIGGTGTRVTV